MTGEALDETAEIERLKARYCRLLDTKDWAGFRGLFTDDFVSDTSRSGGVVIRGADEFVGFVRRALGDRVTVHHVQQPEIAVTSASTATGIWAMQDVVRFAPGLTMRCFGHYDETYRKQDGEWRIASSTLTRLREELQTPILTLFVSDRVRQRFGRAAARRLDAGSR